MPKTIDHDPREPNRKAIVLIGAITAVVTLTIGLSLSFGVREVVEALPIELVLWVSGLLFGLIGGFYIGQWDARRQRAPVNDG